MIDLTNYSHQRGIVILNSQEYRIANRASVDVDVYRRCVQDYAKTIQWILDEYLNGEKEYKEKDVLEALEHKVRAISDWCGDIEEAMDKLQRIFY